MWGRGRRWDQYRALSGEPGAVTAVPGRGRRLRAIAARLLLITLVLVVLAVLITLIAPRRPSVQYACTRFTGIHLDRRHYPYFYISFITFARIVNHNFFPVMVERIRFDVYHWDEKIAETALESRNFPARSRVVEAIHTNATGFTKSALRHLYEDTQDGVITLELRGQAQVRSFARDWRYDIRSWFVHVNLTEWSTRPTSDGPCPPPDYTGPPPAPASSRPIQTSS